MTSGGSMGGQVDIVHVDVVAQTNEWSLRQMQADLVHAGDKAGKAGGGAISGAFGGAVAALPALAATAAAAVGAALVGAGMAAVNFAQQARQGVLDLQASLGVTKAEAEDLGEVAKAVFGNNWTGSLAEAQAAVANVRREIKGLSKEDLQAVTEGSIAISERFEEDQAKVAASVQSLMKATGMSTTEALDFISAGFQKGLNTSGDFLDTLNEYGPQFEKAKISGDQLFSLLETGAAKGTLGTDKVADAFKEFGLTVVSVSDSSKDTYKELGLSQDKLVKGINDGSISQAKAFEIVTNALAKVKGQADRTRIGAAIFGGAGEDFAGGLTQLDLTKTKLSELNGSTKTIKDATSTLGSVFQTAWRQTLIQLQPVGDLLLDLAQEAMPSVQRAIGQLSPIVTQVVRFLVDGFKQGRQVAGEFAPYVQQGLTVLRPVVQQLGPLFVGVFTLIKTLWETVLRPVFIAIAPLVQGVFAQVANALTFALKVVTGVVNAISALLRGDLNGAMKAVEGIFQAGVEFVQRSFTNLGTALLGTIRKLPPQMAAVAGDVVQGLIDGITSRVGAVTEAAQNMATGVLSGIKKKLNIRSPARETYIQGEHAAQGLVNGITDKTPDVQAAAANMAGTVISETQKAREALEKSIKMDAWVDGLRSATAAQLQQAQATARQAGDAERYTAIKAELERREAAATAATEKATDAARQHAQQLADNRAQIAHSEAMERYAKGLRSATAAQLDHALATARTSGDTERYNIIKTEQERRETAATAATEKAAQAQRDLAAALEEGIQAGNAALDSLDSLTLGGRDIAATAQRLPDSARLFTELYGRLGDLRAELQVPGVADAWADSIEEMGRRGQLSAQQVQTLKDVITDLAAVPAPQLLDNLQGRGVQNAPAADDPATGTLASGEGDRLRASMDALNLDDVGRIYADLVLAGLQDSDLGKLIADYLLEQQNAINTALAESGGVSIDVITGEEVYQTEDTIRGIGVAAEDTSDTLLDLTSVIENVLTMPWDEVAALLSASGLKPEQIEKVTQAWRDFHLEAAQTEALDAQLAPVATRLQEVYDQLKAGTLQGADALTALEGVRAELAGIGGDAAQNLIKAVDELVSGVQKGIDTAEQLHTAWTDNLNRLGFQEYVKGLKDMTTAQLEAALEAARASENVAEFNAVLAELQDREVNVTIKMHGIDTGLKELDLYKSVISGVSGVVTQTFTDLVSGTSTGVQSIVKNMGLMALGIVKSVAVSIAAYQAQAIAMALIKGGSFDFIGAAAALAAAAAVAGIAAGLEARLKNSGISGSAGGSATSPSTAATNATRDTVASNNVVTIPSSQVTVAAAPDWVDQMGRHVDRFGQYVERLVTEGVMVSTEPASTAGSSGSLIPKVLNILTP